MTCKNCGKEFDGNFCPNCGEKALDGMENEKNVFITLNDGKRVSDLKKLINNPRFVIGLISLLCVVYVVLWGVGELYNNSDDNSSSNNYFHIGDTISFTQDGSKEFELTFTDCGTWLDLNYSNIYYSETYTYVEYIVQNTGDESIYFNDSDIKCYADGYAVNAAYVYDGDYNDNITLSPGRKASAKIYFDVNVDNVDSLEVEFADAICIIK